MDKFSALLSDRARALLLSFAISHNASDFCRFLTVVAFREFGAVAAVMTRVDESTGLRSVGQYGQPRPDGTGALAHPGQEEAMLVAIETREPFEVELEKPETNEGFLAIPFSPTGEIRGALGFTFRLGSNKIQIPNAELELLQLLSELIAINSLPRIRATGMLSKLYFDSENLEEISAITHRQLRVLDEMAIGKTNGQIARALNLSESTIKQESVRIFKLLGVSTRQRAVSVGKEMGLI
ncbi:MAG: hypothetical protein RLZZ229_790 [Actinomycetota bacterium]|jgi:DNA-binding CsgD family transcriptional regulator